MSVEIKSIKTGAFETSADSEIYTVPEGKSVLIKNMRVVNTNASAVTINLYFKQSGLTKRAILPPGVSLPGKYLLVDDEELTMSEGDQIRGDASATLVDYVLSGVEREII